MFEVGPAGEEGLRLVFLEAPCPALTRCLLRIQSAAQGYFAENLADSVVGYTTLTLFFRPFRLERDRAEAWLTEQADCAALTDSDDQSLTGTVVTLPVLYHPSVAPDLEWLAEQKNISVDQIIALHTGTTYFAYATGFAPGFCYLGDLPTELATPRLADPRAAVPAGAVGLADRQTAVYPGISPGGWRLIGSCPRPLFQNGEHPTAYLAVGDSVRFEAITPQEYRKFGGEL